MRKYYSVCAALSLMGFACAGSQAEQVADARMEQAEARSESNVAAADQRATAREEVIEQRHDVRADAVAESERPGASAAEDIVEVSRDRSEYQSEAKAQLDKLQAQIGEAQQKLSVLGGRAPTQLKGELATTIQQHRMLEQDVDTLGETTPSAWETTSEAIDKRIAKLDDRVEELKDAIDDV